MRQKDTITAYVTRYAFTKGILEVQGEVCYDVSEDMFVYGEYRVYVHKGDWWRTEEEAIAKAEQMRIKKITNLQKNITKLQNLRFGN